MELQQMVKYKKAGRYEEIAKWADSNGIAALDNAEQLFFVAEAYEKTGDADKAIEVYEKGLREFQDDLVPERLFNIYRQLNQGDMLSKMADYLEEECLADDIAMLARFEALRISKISLEELIQTLKEYVEEYNDELYFILLLEFLLENKDLEQAKRYLNKYNRLFIGREYEMYMGRIAEAIEGGSAIDAAVSIKKVIYARTLPEKKNSCDAAQNMLRQPAKQAEEQDLTKSTSKTRIKTKNLVDALNSILPIGGMNSQNQNPPTIEDRFEDVVGMKEIQNQLGNLYRAFRSQQLRQSNDFNADILTTTHFVVTGEPGTGKTMLAKTVGQLLMDFGIRGSEEAVTIESKDFIDNLEQLDGLDDVTLIVENIDRSQDDSGKFGEYSWKMRNFLMNHKENISVILTGTKDAVLSLYGEESDIKRLIYTELSIEEYSEEELVRIFEKIAYDQKWILTDDARELVRKQIAKEKNMSTFECGNSMIEKIKEAAKRAADRMDTLDDPTDEDMVTLVAEDFRKTNIKSSVPELLEKLDSMTGLVSVKEQVNKIVSKLVTAQKAEQAGSKRAMTSEPLHMVFKGAPGTGKTTVARIISDIYMALGVLPGNEEGLVEVSAPDLIGQYVGHTGQKTMAVVNRAMGGVLFVDEAYSLTQNRFGVEAITALLKVMEDSRDCIMVIFAGYVEDIDKLMDINPGLRSRMPTQVIFEDYTEEELAAIFKSMVKADHRILGRDTNDAVMELIRSGSKALDFGNARGVRNLVGLVEAALDERLFNMVSNGIQPTTNDYEIIRKEDIEAVLNHSTDGSKTLDELLEDLNSLEGLTELKQIVMDNVRKVKAAQKKKELGLNGGLEVDNLHMVFTGGPGTGKTTAARKVGYIYKALGILPRGDSVIECSRPELVGEYQGHTAPKVMEKVNHAMGGVLFIDEAYTLSRDTNDAFGKEAIDTLVKPMEDNRGQFMVILAGYTEEMNHFLDQNPGLRSRVAHTVLFEDFTIEQMVSIFEKLAEKNHYTIEETAKTAIRSLLEEKSKVKDFGNARGVRKVWKNVLTAVDNRIIDMGDDVTKEACFTIKREDIMVLMDEQQAQNEKTVEELLNELDQMIGLNAVKTKVRQIVDQARFNKLAADRGLGKIDDDGSLHLLFKGNAGTGKTTVAQMLGQIYKQLGVLRTGECITCTRSDLIAGYVGQTGAKTQEYINKAMGGILFVDEAYTLAQGGENDFGMEALTTIMTAMENHRDDLMVIFAGYSKEIDGLIDKNQGLESRFPKQNEIIFEDYTEEELLQIFLYQAKKNGMIVGEELYQDISAIIAGIKREARNFGNARAVRNLVEAINLNRKQRIVSMGDKGLELSNEEFSRIIRADLENV